MSTEEKDGILTRNAKRLSDTTKDLLFGEVRLHPTGNYAIPEGRPIIIVEVENEVPEVIDMPNDKKIRFKYEGEYGDFGFTNAIWMYVAPLDRVSENSCNPVVDKLPREDKGE